jgi:hypothetical protein
MSRVVDIALTCLLGVVLIAILAWRDLTYRLSNGWRSPF